MPRFQFRKPWKPLPLSVERLEDRLAPAIIRWNTDADGSWHVAGNWLDEFNVVRLPTSSDNVILDRGAANPVITTSSSVTVASLVANESLHITNGSFRATSDLTLNAPWQLSGGFLYAHGSTLTLEHFQFDPCAR